MCSFQGMSNALIKRLERHEGRIFTHAKGSHNPSNDHMHQTLEKVNFLEFWGSTDERATKAWFKNMIMCFDLRDYTSNLKVHVGVSQMKGSALLWWKILLP